MVVIRAEHWQIRQLPAKPGGTPRSNEVCPSFRRTDLSFVSPRTLKPNQIETSQPMPTLRHNTTAHQNQSRSPPRSAQQFTDGDHHQNPRKAYLLQNILTNWLKGLSAFHFA